MCACARPSAWVLPYDKMLAGLAVRTWRRHVGRVRKPQGRLAAALPATRPISRRRRNWSPLPAADVSTTLQFDAGNATVAEPMSVLIKEALGAIGINVEISKVPGANFRTEIAKKTNPMTLNRFAGWLDYPDYYLFWTMHGNNSIFNIANYQNSALDKLIDAARFAAATRPNTTSSSSIS